MPKRRCMSTQIYHSSTFTRLCDKAKNLYTLFLLNTDDWGFVETPEFCMALAKATNKELNELLNSGLVLKVDEALVIVHFYNHNKNLYKSKRDETFFSSALEKLTMNKDKEYIIKG